MSASGIFPNDDWAIAQGETDSGPILLRFRKSEPNPVDQQQFNKLIVARWAYQAADQSGLPSPATVKKMDEFEDFIFEKCDKDRWWGSGVAVITHNGIREWRFYTPDLESFQKEFGEALRNRGPYRLELEVFDDPDWNAFFEIRNSAA